MSTVHGVEGVDAQSFISGTTLVDSATNSVTSPSPAQTGPRTLHIYRDSVLNTDSHYTVRDSDDRTEIYIADISPMTRPQIQIYSSAEYAQKSVREAAITAKLHHTDTDVEITVRTQKFFYVANGWLRKKYQWPSPAFGMNILNWRRELSYGTKECYPNDDKKHVLARWVSAGWSASKVGELQILAKGVSTGAGSPALEELLVTLLADREIDSRLTSA